MNSLIHFALLAGFYFVVDTIIVALVTKQFRIKGASVAKASLVVLCAWVLDMFLSLPLLFVFPENSPAYATASIITAFIAGAIVLKNIFSLRFPMAFLVSGVSALIFELVMSLFWSFGGG